jgi:polynucleotide 5'-hydroxyl-kinase GRC3/NOL9
MLIQKGDKSGILGILCYGDQPPADLLLESINGSLVAIVVVDDMSAIPGWDAQDKMGIQRAGTYPKDSTSNESADKPLHLHQPLIIQTPISDLPYFNPLNSIYISPTGSHCIGLALIRGVDISM